MKSCKQCGTCCRKGGPALHRDDLDLITNGYLPLTNLVTIREGEPVFSPISGEIEPAQVEIIKLSTANSWCCPFLPATNNQCSIYQSRPCECRLLKCWDTTDISNVIYLDSLNRRDLIDSKNVIWELIELHDNECSYKAIMIMAEKRKEGEKAGSEEKLQEISAKDLAIREKAINSFNLSLPEELFYFGRPIFKSLDFFR